MIYVFINFLNLNNIKSMNLKYFEIPNENK